jgi:type I restriction enzyme M protein
VSKPTYFQSLDSSATINCRQVLAVALPHVPDAWIDTTKTKVGYEIPLNRYFYYYEPPRPLEVIETDIKRLEGEILKLLREVTA